MHRSNNFPRRLIIYGQTFVDLLLRRIPSADKRVLPVQCANKRSKTTDKCVTYDAPCRYSDGTIVEQLYSVPLTLELASSRCPAEVTQHSFEETGFLQHQPTETVLPFEEWRCGRFGNMRPAVVLHSVEMAAKCMPTESLSRENEAHGLLEYLECTPVVKSEQARLSNAQENQDVQGHTSADL